jgi:oligopeptide transport system permease protein
MKKENPQKLKKVEVEEFMDKLKDAEPTKVKKNLPKPNNVEPPKIEQGLPKQDDINEDDLFVLVEIDVLKSEQIKSEPYSYFKSVFAAFLRKPSAWIAMITLFLMLLGIIIIPTLTPEGFFDYNVDERNIRPNSLHFWGTDAVGRDLFFMVWSGARKSLVLALINSGIVVFVGTIIGLVWGYFRRLDFIFVEIYNLVINIPSLLIYMLLSFIFAFSFPSMPTEIRLIIALTLVGWVGLARLVRNYVLIISNREYNVASKTLGTPGRRIMTKNLLPYLLGVIITEISLTIPGMISSEVTLSYFGLGLPSSSVSIGALLDLGRSNFVLYPFQLLAPAGVMALIIFVFFLLGMAISDALDPKKHH